MAYVLLACLTRDVFILPESDKFTCECNECVINLDLSVCTVSYGSLFLPSPIKGAVSISYMYLTHSQSQLPRGITYWLRYDYSRR